MFRRLEADFRPAQHDRDLRPHPFEGGDHFGCLRHVPDINSQPDDLRVIGKNGLHHVERALLDVKLGDAGLRAERAEIGQQIAQAKRRVDVLGVERGENDACHALQIQI